MRLDLVLAMSAIGAVIASPTLATEALPPPTQADIQVIGRVLGFQERAQTTSALLAIVFDATNSASKIEAERFRSLLESGVDVGGVAVHAELVEQNALARSSSNLIALITTTGVNDALVATALRRLHVPCLTRHLEQVERGACTIAISLSPSVEIVLNDANARSDGVRFATAFCMMVHEV